MSRTECSRCGGEVAVLRRPLKRLRGTRFWWRGVASVFGQPLRFCHDCGALYDYAGRLLASGVAETRSELKVRGYRDDMVSLRDGFGTVFVASQVTVLWTILGPVGYDAAVTVLAGSVGVAALFPFAYFAGKARKAKRELKKMKAARLEGPRE